MLINLFLSFFFVEDNVIMTLRFAKKPIIPKIDWETIVIIGSFRKAAKTSVSLFVKSNSGFPVSVWRETFSILQYCHFSSMHLDLIQQSMNTALTKSLKYISVDIWNENSHSRTFTSIFRHKCYIWVHSFRILTRQLKYLVHTVIPASFLTVLSRYRL